MKNIIIQRFLKDIKNLQMMPGTHKFLTKIDFNYEGYFDELVRVIEVDQGLTANLLIWANSAWSQPEAPITSVRDAVVRIGAKRVVNMTIMMALTSPLMEALPTYNLHEQDLARHSMGAFFTIQEYQTRSRRQHDPFLATAALLHDIGKLLLERYMEPMEKQRLVIELAKGKKEAIELETEILGINHAELGGAMANEWEFPDNIVKIIFKHHHFAKNHEDAGLYAVQFANLLAQKIMHPGNGEIFIHHLSNNPLYSEHLSKLELTLEEARALHAEVEKSIQNMETLLAH
jgi:putative nucleotidyltransferase with HDIG domain